MTAPCQQQLYDLLAAALDRSPGDFTPEDVFDLARTGDVRLWPGQKSIGVTEDTKALHVWLAAGDLAECMAILRGAENECRARGYDFVTVQDMRPGWRRVLKKYGYVEKTLLVKEL